MTSELNIALRDFEKYKEKNKYAIIDIQSLEELMKLNKDYGDIVIQQPNYIKGIPEIEIYDTYRE